MAASLSFRLEASLRSPAEGRARLRAGTADLLGGSCNAQALERVINDVELIASELLTNATRAGAQSIEVRLESVGDCLRLTVTDDAPGQPTPRRADDHDVSGRGLAIVAAVAEAWGVDRGGSAGKSVWADVRTRPIATRS